MTDDRIASQERPEYRTGEDTPEPGSPEYRIYITNEVLDEVMPGLSPTEWKALWFIIRKTAGCGKEKAAIFFHELTEGTGIESEIVLRSALHSLEGGMWIDRIFRTDGLTGEPLPTEYAINIEGTEVRDR